MRPAKIFRCTGCTAEKSLRGAHAKPGVHAPVYSGARVDEVDEPDSGARAVVLFEFEDYPEAKALTGMQLRALYERYRSFYRVGETIGASEAFARQNAWWKERS